MTTNFSLTGINCHQPPKGLSSGREDFSLFVIKALQDVLDHAFGTGGQSTSFCQVVTVP